MSEDVAHNHQSLFIISDKVSRISCTIEEIYLCPVDKDLFRHRSILQDFVADLPQESNFPYRLLYTLSGSPHEALA